MKKFKFSMDKILNYKEQILSSEKIKLSAINHERNVLANDIEKLTNELNSIQFTLSRKIKEGMTIFEINQYNFKIKMFQEEIERLKEELFYIDKRIEEQRQVVLNASIYVSSLEKLKDKNKLEHNKKLIKSESLEVEEMVLRKLH